MTFVVIFVFMAVWYLFFWAQNYFLWKQGNNYMTTGNRLFSGLSSLALTWLFFGLVYLIFGF